MGKFCLSNWDAVVLINSCSSVLTNVTYFKVMKIINTVRTATMYAFNKQIFYHVLNVKGLISFYILLRQWYIFLKLNRHLEIYFYTRTNFEFKSQCSKLYKMILQEIMLSPFALAVTYIEIFSFTYNSGLLANFAQKL